MANKHVIMIIDRSGSMGMIQKEMNNVLSRWVDENRDNKFDVTSVLFDDQYEVTNDRTKIKKLDALSLMIEARGSTALYDAIMRATASVGPSEKPLVMIITDGQENSSQEYTRNLKAVQERLASLEKQGATIQYLSSSVTAFSDSASFGIQAASTSAYTHDVQGTQVFQQSVRSSTAEYLSKTS